MGWFGSQGLSIKFCIVLGSAILTVFVAGLIKVWYNKRRLARNIKIEELEKANNTQERLNVEQLGEGDLFGVRAIERGFFGGVSQSRSNSPAQSMFGPPSTTSVNLTETSRKLEAIRGASEDSSSQSSLSRHSSEISVPKTIKNKPTPLRLQPSAAEIRRSNMPKAGGSYIPPSPSLLTNIPPRTTSLGVNFSHPSVSESPIRTPSEEDLAQLRYQEETPRNFMFLAGQHSNVQSQAGSIYGSAESSPNNPASIPKIPTPPAPTHVFGFPPRFSQRSRSTSPEDFSSGSERSSTASPDNDLPVPAIPPRYKNAYQPTTLEESSTSNTPAKRRSYQPTQPSDSLSSRDQDQDLYTYYHDPSLAPSPLKTRPSILDHPSLSSSNPDGLSRTHNSLLLSRKSSAQEHRISRDRDQMHYDPTSRPSARNRSGSVQGRAVDFDTPRESPFADANRIGCTSGHGRNGSSGSSGSESESERESSSERGMMGRGRGRERERRGDASDLV